MNADRDYETGRDIRRKGKPATDCSNAEQRNGYWYQDSQMPRVNDDECYFIVIPQSAGRVDVWR